MGAQTSHEHQNGQQNSDAYLIEHHLSNSSLYQELCAFIAWKHGHIQPLQHQKALAHGGLCITTLCSVQGHE
jgi:hypothetical protein